MCVGVNSIYIYGIYACVCVVYMCVYVVYVCVVYVWCMHLCMYRGLVVYVYGVYV